MTDLTPDRPGVPVPFRLSLVLLAKVDKQVKKRFISRSAYIRDAVVEKLNRDMEAKNDQKN